jgi:hypothetical protein
MMIGMSRTTNDVLEEKRLRALGEPALSAGEKERLQVLVGELLKENQRLRFENEDLRVQTQQLEQQKQSAEDGLAAATKWVGMIL